MCELRDPKCSNTALHQKMKFSIKDFFSKCDQIRMKLTFTEEILNGKLHFLEQCRIYLSEQLFSK